MEVDQSPCTPGSEVLLGARNAWCQWWLVVGGWRSWLALTRVGLVRWVGRVWLGEVVDTIYFRSGVGSIGMADAGAAS